VSSAPGGSVPGGLPSAGSTGPALHVVVDRSAIVVCCGSGGVGKTTTAAAIAVEGARRGRRSCVVTIDPARRLADALGLDELTNKPGQVAGDWGEGGELWALMLDTKSTFDELVHRYADTPEQADSILNNRLYRNLSGALSGTQEYMAMEKLFELHEDHDFDLIVVDTPPTRHALDFLDAPRRLTRFLDNRIFRLLMMPTRAYLRAVSVATQAFLRTVAKVVGSEVVKDAVAFFAAFEGMEEGFRNRAQRVLQLLSEPETAFILVTAPRRDAIDEALYFARRLEESSISIEGLIVNRLHPQFRPLPAVSANGSNALAGLLANARQLEEVSAREERNFDALARRVAPAAVSRVPFLADDVHDLEGLRAIGAYLFV
jgi:anion-transporting  ArsA/GET3 family ATPase